MKNQAGFIVRFVDVVLILLFGFISISTIRETTVVLPSSEEAIILPPNTDETVYVGIDSDGSFLVDEERRVLTSVDDLERYVSDIARLRSAEVPVIRIRAMYDAPMGTVQAAIQLCTATGFETSLAVRLAAD